MSIEQARATEAFRILEPVVTPRLNRGLEYGLVLYAFLLPFAKLTHLLEYFFLTLFAIWVIREASLRRFAFRKTPIDLPLFLFMLWVLMTVTTATDPWYSFHEWRKTLTRLLMLYFVVNIIEGEDQVRRVVLAFVGGACLQSLIGIVKFYGDGGVLPNLTVRAAALTGSSQWFATFLIMSLPFFWLGFVSGSRPVFRWLYAAMSVPALVGVYFAHTRAAWVALGIQAIVFVSLKLIRSGRVAAIPAALVLVSIFAAAPFVQPQKGFMDPYTMGIRLKTWQFAVSEDVATHPLMGLGYGRHSFSQAHPDAHELGYSTHVHNVFLSTAVEVGLPGFLLFSWMFLRILTSCYGSWKRAPGQYSGQLALALLLTTVGVIVRNLFDHMFVGTQVYLCFLLVGLKFSLDCSTRHGPPQVTLQSGTSPRCPG